MGYLDERKMSFNLGEEEGLKTEMTGFDQLCHQGLDIRRESFPFQQFALKVLPSQSAIVPSLKKPEAPDQMQLCDFPYCPGHPSVAKGTADVHTHAQTELALFRSKQFQD